MRRVLLAMAVIAAIGYVIREPLLQAAGDFLVVSDRPVPVDAAIVIGGDGVERIAAARRLLDEGRARWLVLSGGPYGRGLNSATLMHRQAVAAGVTPERILVDDRAESTSDNAEGAARRMASRSLRSGVVLTSPYHTRRAGVIFARVFGHHNLEARVMAVDDGHFRVDRWWTRANDRRLVVREYLKLAAFLGGAR